MTLITERLLKIYMMYSLFIGVTSYKIRKWGCHSTRFTTVYASVINVATVIVFPILMWLGVADYQATHMFFPRLVWLSTYVLFFVNYCAVLYAVLSRRSRDAALVQISDVVQRISTRMTRTGNNYLSNMDRSLRYLFYWKYATVVYLCTSSIIQGISLTIDHRLWFLSAFFVINIMNIRHISPFGYFLGLWNMCIGFSVVNRRLTNLYKQFGKSIPPTEKNLIDLRRLWALHVELTNTTLRIQKTYNIHMLAARFDYIITTVVNAYWGYLNTFTLTNTPLILIVYASINFLVQALDFFLNDFVCDLVVQKQGLPQHKLSTCRWDKELSAFTNYKSSSNLSLWVCGLYKVNRQRWFFMMGTVISYSIMLVQFHLVLRKSTIAEDKMSPTISP